MGDPEAGKGGNNIDLTINIHVGGEALSFSSTGTTRTCPSSLYAQSNGWYYYHTVNCTTQMYGADVKSQRQLSTGCYAGNPDCTSTGGFFSRRPEEDGGLDAYLDDEALPVLMPGSRLVGDDVYRVAGTDHWVRVFTIDSRFVVNGRTYERISRITQEVREHSDGAPELEVVAHRPGSGDYLVRIDDDCEPFCAQIVRACDRLPAAADGRV